MMRAFGATGRVLRGCGSVRLLAAVGPSMRCMSSAVPPPPSSPPSSSPYFEVLDSLWNTKWFGTVDAPRDGGLVSNDPGVFGTLAETLHATAGVEYWATLLLLGGAVRLFTLYFSLKGERASARMQQALPELKEPQEAFNAVYYDGASSAMEVQVAAAKLKSERRRVFAAYQTSNAQCLASFMGAPFMMYGAYTASSLCASPAVSVGTAAFFWCPALALPDPFFVLPTAFCVLTLLNFELSISEEIKRGWMRNVIWGARLGCLCVIPVAATFRSGVCLYFIGMSLVGLLQPVLLRLPAFRERFGFPPRHATPQVSPVDDELQAQMAVQFPYLGHLLQPRPEDNAELFAKAAATSGTRGSKPSFTGNFQAAGSGRGRQGAGNTYAAGANPLMREVPVLKQQQQQQQQEPQHSTERLVAAKGRAGKGTSFASSGWKTSQVTFTEEDFAPDFGKGDDSKGGRGGRR